MSSGGRSAEQQAVAEHNLEGQHQALLQELRDECGKDCKRPHRHTFNFAPPCVDPAMDENLTRNAQLSVLELSPCRFEQHQPVEFGFRVQSLFEPTHGKPTKIVLQATPGELRPTPLELTNALIFVNADDEEKLALEEQVASLQRKLDGSLQRNLDDSLQRYLVAKQLRTELAEAHAEIETHEAEVAACCIFAAAEAKHRQRQHDQKIIDQLRVLLAIASRQPAAPSAPSAPAAPVAPVAPAAPAETGAARVGRLERLMHQMQTSSTASATAASPAAPATLDRAEADEARLADSEAAVEVASEELASEELQVTSLQCKFGGARELAVEASGMVQPLYEAFCSLDQHPFVGIVQKVTEAHLRRVYMLFAACTFATLQYVLFLAWRVLDAKADLVAFEARAVSYSENCQDIAANCESVKTDIWSHFSAQVAFAAWLRGLGLD